MFASVAQFGQEIAMGAGRLFLVGRSVQAVWLINAKPAQGPRWLWGLRWPGLCSLTVPESSVVTFGGRGAARVSDAFIRFENVGLRYGVGPEVLRDVSFEVGPKSFQFLTGPSGAGKTTLIRL